MFSSDVASRSISTWWGLDFYDEVWKGKNEQCEHVLFGEMLPMLDKGHVDDFAVLDTPVFLPVDHWLEVLVDRGIELFQLLVLADGTQAAETTFDRGIAVQHGFRLFKGCEVLAFLEREDGEKEGNMRMLACLQLLKCEYLLHWFV